MTKRSAVKWGDKFPKGVPILMLHGNADWRVKPEQSLKLAIEFEKHRIQYRLIMYEGGDHGISEHQKEVDQEIMNWFDKYLKNDKPLPNMEDKKSSENNVIVHSTLWDVTTPYINRYHSI